MKILFLFTTIVMISKVYQKKSPENKKEMRKLGSLDLEKIKKIFYILIINIEGSIKLMI